MNKPMRRLLSLCLFAALVLGLLSACGSPGEVQSSPPSESESEPSHAEVTPSERYGDPEDYRDPSNSDASVSAPASEPGNSGVSHDDEFAVWETGRSLDIPFNPADDLEMPVAGATGFTSVDLLLWQDLPASDVCKVANGASASTAAVSAELFHGTSFVIIQESGDWWQIRTEARGSSGGKVGWVEHRYCLINLPDVIPSMIYNNTNSDSSVIMSSFTKIPGITGMPLYHQSTMKYNARLGRDEYMMPVLNSMAKKVCKAQQNALSAGNTLVLYEGYRPHDTQLIVMSGVRKLAAAEPEVQAGISTYPWDISWFIGTDISTHQQGCAIDISLARVYKSHMESIDGYEFVQIDDYQEYFMSTPIHELSQFACTYTAPVEILSDTAWQSAIKSAAMEKNEPAKAMQGYCTLAGLTPMASHWWYFNDLDAYRSTGVRRSTGNYDISDCDCMSLTPSSAAG